MIDGLSVEGKSQTERNIRQITQGAQHVSVGGCNSYYVHLPGCLAPHLDRSRDLLYWIY